MIGADFILSAILGVLKPLWPYIVAAVVALGWGLSQRRAGAKAERNAQKAKEADAYAKHIKDVEDAAYARDHVSGNVESDPRNRDRLGN